MKNTKSYLLHTMNSVVPAQQPIYVGYLEIHLIFYNNDVVKCNLLVENMNSFTKTCLISELLISPVRKFKLFPKIIENCIY